MGNRLNRKQSTGCLGSSWVNFEKSGMKHVPPPPAQAYIILAKRETGTPVVAHRWWHRGAPFGWASRALKSFSSRLVKRKDRDVTCFEQTRTCRLCRLCLGEFGGWLRGVGGGEAVGARRLLVRTARFTIAAQARKQQGSPGRHPLS